MRKIKKSLTMMVTVALTVVVLAFGAGAAQAEQAPGTSIWLKVDSPTGFVNNQEVTLYQSPMLWNDTLYVSLRDFAEFNQAVVKWDWINKTLIATTDLNSAVFWIGTENVDWNGVSTDMNATLFVKNNFTLIPLPIAADLFGWSYTFNAAEGFAALTKK